ncbi:MAG TPA: catalase-related domain-containing protein, partial [Thiolinea sp.]|nr:catalase-related domain-containing protein [Thiolinea sp.]
TPTEGTRMRIRPESFADHYSQARLFYVSQTPTEQTHMVNAMVFELSKVKTAAIRERVVSRLLNVDKGLAQQVADGLGLEKLPAAAKAAVAPHDMPASAALSIIKNGPNSFKGRKLGIFVSEGSDAALVKGLKEAAEAEGAACAVIAPKISGVKLSDGKVHPVDEKIGGGPSVVFDAVAVIPSKAGAELLKKDGPSKDFVADAFAHCKFIAYNDDAMPLFKAVSIDSDLDGGCIKLAKADDAKAFIKACGKLRFWEREPNVSKS